MDIDCQSATPESCPQEAQQPEAGMHLVAVVQVSLESEWFRLDSKERTRYRGQLARILTSTPEIRCRWFDSEPWTGSIAEFFVCEFTDLQAYWRFWNELREHPIFRESLARIRRVSMGVENSLAEESLFA